MTFIQNGKVENFCNSNCRILTCIERRLEPLLDRDKSGGRRFVAPRPANRLFNKDGERAQINAWNDDTVNTPSLLRVFLVGRET